MKRLFYVEMHGSIHLSKSSATNCNWQFTQ